MRIVPHLGHIQTTVLVERRRDGVIHQRFGGHQLHPKAVEGFECLEGLFRLLGWDRLQDLLKRSALNAWLCLALLCEKG